MISRTIRVRASLAGVQNAIMRAPATSRSGGAVADAMMTRCGLAALGRIKKAFVTKSRGGVDEAGEKWKPLSPTTIAYRLTRQRGWGGRTRAQKARPAHPSQALTAGQQARWWQVYRRQLAIYKGNKAHAAAVAWIVLKKEGAQTLVHKYGGVNVDILRDTGLLLNSLSPAKTTDVSIFKVSPGEVAVGTNRKGAIYHHVGTARLPQRRLWPEPGNWPSSWWLDILEQLQQGLLDLVVELVQGA